jgi:tetratricopeptide (TPR) repeat protein
VKRLIIPLLAVLVVAGACQRQPRDDQQTGSVSAADLQRAREQLSPEVRGALDSGNEAYREGRYLEAREHYQQAVQRDPEAAAGWFGLYMAELALGNAEAAEAAIRRAREAAPRASLLEPEPEPAPETAPETAP